MNLFRISCSAALLIFAATAVSAQPALKRANKQYELGVFKLAAESYKDFLSKNSDNAEANAKLGDCYRHLNQQEKALPHYQTAVSSPDVQDIYIFQYGLTLQELGRYDLAKGVFNSLGEKSPEFKARCKQFSDACVFANAANDPAAYKVTNEFANTASFDFGPCFFGDQVVYASGRTDIKGRDNRAAPASNGGGDGTNRLFITQRDKNGFLDVPVTLHSGFGVGVNEAPAAYSPDGKLVAFTRNNFIDGTRMMPSSGMELNLFIAQAKPDGDWETPLAFPHNGVDFSTGYPNFSPDGKALYFSSDRPGGYGGFDIYVSYRVGNNWSAPENVGNAVNTLGNEITPFSDGNSLYFASDYQKGFGGFDIFRAEESGGSWATVYHGGTGLNSSTDDYGFIFDSGRNIGYMVSNRSGGKGSEDIYRIVKESESVVIKVTDALTGATVPGATIDFSDCGVANQFTNVNGLFTFSLNDNLDCTAKVSKEGFSGKSVKITTLGMRQSRTLEVALTNEDNSYNGKVVNGSNNQALEDAKIIATNPTTKEETTTRTDANGAFSIALKPKTTYQMRYSKEGFKDFTNDFTASTSNQKNLEVTAIFPVGSSAAGGSVSKEIPPKQTSSPTYTPAAATSTADLIDGFAVQLAATTGNPSLKPYEEKVGAMGSVFTVSEGGKTKVRLGVFDTKEAADAAQAKAKVSGFPGAFIVPQKGKSVATKPAAKAKEVVQPKPADIAIKAIPGENKAAPAATTSTALDGYLVKLAAYRDLKNFKQNEIEDVGLVHFVKKGDFTIVVLGGFDSKTAAQAGLDKAKKRGYPDALLVTMVGSELKKAN